MPSGEPGSLAEWLEAAGDGRYLLARDATVQIGALAQGTALGGDRPKLQDRSVLIATRNQLTAALTLIELDGFARRLILLTPDVPSAQLPAIIADAEIDAAVVDAYSDHGALSGLPLRVTCQSAIQPAPNFRSKRRLTEWLLFTSGTIGIPKMVSHSLASLTAPIKRRPSRDASVVWATFYDIRRYGGLQIFLRAIIDGGSFILSDADEPVGDFLIRLGKHGVTRISGTPSHWRQVLMSPFAQAMSPGYVRLSGEIADQGVLDRLAEVYSNAQIGHAYASTEAGVGFEVNDGREGFPADLIEPSGDVEMKIVDGSLRIRSPRTASRYFGSNAALTDDDGFVDTGDMLERRGDRYYFVGRRGGIINVGGLKVHPEEIETVINRHPQVRMSLVRSKKSPVTGAIVIADVVLKPDSDNSGNEQNIKNAIFDLCRQALPRHKVPVAITFVPSLDVAVTGKLARRHG
jgi:acyl-coenzyme A synthetase/AMP-(fatty) acid ligase